LGQEETLSGPAEVEFLGKDEECLNLIERHAHGLAQIADDSAWPFTSPFRSATVTAGRSRAPMTGPAGR
jgi:hypothetical protein